MLISKSKWEYKEKDDVDIGGTFFRVLWLKMGRRQAVSDLRHQVLSDTVLTGGS